MEIIANRKPFTQEELDYIQTKEFKNKFVGKSNQKDFEEYLNSKNDSYIDKIEYTQSIVKKLFGIADIFQIKDRDIIFKCFDSLSSEFPYVNARSVLYRYGNFLNKNKGQAMSNEFTNEEKNKFLKIIQEFLDKVDELRLTGYIDGTNENDFPAKKYMRELLENIGYLSHFNFGQTNMLGGKWQDNNGKDNACSIAFYRIDTIGDNFVNKTRHSLPKDIYIWLGYADQEEQPNIFLTIGTSAKEAPSCKARDKLIQKRDNGKWEFSYNSNDFEAQKEQITKDFLYLVKEFNNIPLEYFKPKGDTMDNNKTKIPPLNQILYGPPGTGKTYSTIDKALEILGYAKSNDNGKVILDYTKIKQKLQNIANNNKGVGLDLENLDSKSGRELAKLLFDYYRSAEQGQIEFVTFHQSFSYEEFVEGIKPNVENENAEMTYEVKDGIFKQICIQARQNLKEFVKNQQSEIGGRKQHNDDLDKNKTLWRLYTLPAGKVENDYFDECIEQNCVKVWGNYDKDKLGEAENGDYIVIPSANYGEMSKTIRAFGILGGEKKTDEQEEYCKEVEWLWIAESKDKILRFNEANFNRATFQRVKQGKEVIIDYMNVLLNKDNANFETKPYILIIDEINRGNISKILGELITLIEPSKRIGASEELRVTLPYSNETFGVPSNLYIIGTMNTADRSIALLDTALRRRFEFIEMMPNPKLLKDNKVENTGINLQTLLEKMNERIEFLLDREHTIGHSFFIGVDSLSKLCEVFKLKIIPLLQEYFYDDYVKIQAVLNDNDMIKPKPKPEFLSKFSDEVDSEKVVYEIEKEWQKWESWQFVKIYNSKATKPQNQDFNKSSENE